jgi:CBS domain-containing protein
VDRDGRLYTGQGTLGYPYHFGHGAHVIACHVNDGISQAEALIRDNRVRRLPVLDQQGYLAGIISLNDLAREA